jgi:hypothetical protein
MVFGADSSVGSSLVIFSDGKLEEGLFGKTESSDSFGLLVGVGVTGLVGSEVGVAEGEAASKNDTGVTVGVTVMEAPNTESLLR